MLLARTSCRLALSFSLTLLVFALPALAQTKVFNGSVNGNWNTPNNWTPAGVPGPADTVSVPAGAPALVIDANVDVASLEIARSTTFSGGRTVITPTASITAGTFRLGSNSTLSGGTWAVDPAATLTFDGSCSNRLLNLTINGNLTFDSTTGRVRWNNTAVNGAITVTGGCNPSIAFEGDQTLNVSGGITVAGTVTCILILEQQAAGTLTIPAGVTISGGNVTLGGSSCFGQAMTLAHNGTITSEQASRTVTITAPVSGTGTLAVSTGTLQVNNAVSGIAFNVSGGTLNFGGTFNPASIGSFTRSGGAVNVTGIADLASGAFTLNNSTGQWRIASNGTFRNGTLNIVGDNPLLFDSGCNNRLLNMTINGNLLFDSATSRVRWNNTAVNGAINVTGGCNPSIAFEGDQTFNVSGGVTVAGTVTCTMIFEQQAAGTLTIPAGVTISGGNVTLGGSSCFGQAMTLVHNGTITSEQASRTVTITAPVSGTGTLAVSTGTLQVNNAVSGIAFNVSGGTLNFGGTFNPASIGSFTRSGGTVNVTGIADLASGAFTLNNSTGQWRIASNGTFRNGTLNIVGDNPLLFDSGCNNRLLNMTINGNLLFDSATSRVRWNNVAVNGAITVTGGCNPSIAFEGDQTLNVSGGITVAGTVTCTLILEQQAAGTLTIPAGVTISGGNVTLGGSSCFGQAMTLAHNGTITSEQASRTVTITAPVSGTGTLAVSTGTLQVNNAVSGIAFNVSGGTLNFGGTFNPASIGSFTRSGGTVNITGTASLASGAFTFNTITGSWILNGGTFQNGTVNFTDGQRLVISSSCSNRLVNLTINGTLLFDSGTNRTRWNNTAVNGAITVTGGCNPSIGFEGDQTLNVSGGITVDTACTMIFEQQAVGTLTIPAGVTISGGNISVGGSNCHGQAMTLVNNGTISSTVNGRTLTIAAAGGTTNNGTISATGTANLTFSGPFNNSATGSVSTAGGTFNFTPSGITNDGSITIDATTVNLSGTFNPSALAGINRTGGTINVNGTADLQGGTFTFNTTTGSWILNGGTFQNGTVNFTDGQRLVISSSCSNRLVNLTINGTLLFDSGTSRTRWNNTAVNGAINVTGGCNPSIGFEGDQTLNVSGGITVDTPCTMVFEQQAVGTLTIPAGLTISGGNINFGGSNCHGQAMTLVNNGTISSTVNGRTLTIAAAGGATNNGTISATGTANLTVTTSLANTASGSIDTAAGTFSIVAAGLTGTGSITTNATTLNLNGPFNPIDLPAVTRTGGTVNVNSTADLDGGTFTFNSSTGTWILNSGTFQNGTVNFTDGQRLAISSACANRLVNLTINGNLLFDSGTSRTRWNNTAVNGAITVTGGCNPSIGFEGDQTLNVSGGITVDTACTMVFEQQAVGTLTIPAGLTISGGNINFGGSNCFGLAMTLVNNGTLDASIAGRSINFNHNLTLTNYDAVTGTLTGGTWRVSAPNATFQFTAGGSNPVFNVRTIAEGTAVTIAGNQNATPAFIANLTTIDGSFTVANNRRIAITPQGGTLNANGTLTLSNVGRLNVTGNVIFGTLSVFNADISGTSQSGAFSQLAATGTVARAGVFNVTYFQNIPPPNCANVFPLLTSGVTNGLTGSFSTTNIPPSPSTTFAVGIVNIPGVGLSLVTSTVADIASTDGQPGRDGLVNNGDFLLFIASFFSGCDLPGETPCGPADIAQTDATPGPDGNIDNGDFLLFVTAFFTGCE